MRPDRVQVRAGPVSGTVRAPPSKSITHRAFLLAAQSRSPSTVRNPLLSQDTRATLASLHQMGARVHLDADSDAVQFLPAPLRPPREIIDCGNSGTTLRLLCGLAARFTHKVSLSGDDSLRTRPNGDLLAALHSLGAVVESKDGKAPITIQGPLRSGAVRLPADASSQSASSLLCTLPFLTGTSTLALDPGQRSLPYVDVTVEIAQAAGLTLVETPARGRVFEIPGGQVPDLGTFEVEGDWSSAVFPLVAAAVTGGKVTVAGLRMDSRQGDRRIVEILRSFAATVQADAGGVTCEGGEVQTPGVVDLAATPDLFPALAVLASVARGRTIFTGGAGLRTKECDRIAAMAEGLKAMGVEVLEKPDGLDVVGAGPGGNARPSGNAGKGGGAREGLRGATIQSRDDHRIHMAFVVAGLAASGVTTVDGAWAAGVSYPGFHSDVLSLGAPLTVLQGSRTVVA